MSAVFVKVANTSEFPECARIRHEVFVVEQNVPSELEMDEHDATALHLIARQDGSPVGTARILVKDDGMTAKIGRVAVLPQARGCGIGRTIMQAIETLPELAGTSKLKLDSQSHALPFYERLGYSAEGPEFMDAGIPHRHMIKARKSPTQSF